MKCKWPVLFAILWVGRCFAAETRIISDFESDAELAEWTCADHSAAQLTDEPRAVASGRHAVKISYPASGGYPSFRAERRQLVGDWSGFDLFKADLFNPRDRIVTLSVRFDDSETTKWFTAAYAELTLRPGRNSVEVPLANLKTADGARTLDLTNVRSFNFFLGEPKEAVVLYLDHVRLENSAAAEAHVPGLQVFDFGPARSPLWAGATRVTAASRFDPHIGFGWIESEGIAEGDLGAPDALAGDWVGGSHYEPFTRTFRISVPAGEYGVAVLARPPTPVRTYRVKAGGTTQLEKIITAKTAPTAENLFAGMQREYAPNQDAFAKYVEPEFPVRVGHATTRAAHLNIVFESCNAHFLAVWPVAAQAQAEQWLRTLQEERRKEFFAKHYFLQLHADPKPPDAWPEADRRRGYAVFTRPLHRPIYPNSVPAPVERARELTLDVPWLGSDTASFAIHAFDDLHGVEVSMSNLTWGLGLWPAEDVVLREVRYLEQQGPRGVFTPRPAFLAPVQVVADMPRGFTRQYVLIVRNPIRNYTPYHADITIRADGRPTTTLRVTVNVLPFELPFPDHFTVSYYYSNPWSDGLNYRYALTGDREGAREMLRRELADLRAHGCNSLMLSFPSATISRDQDGKVQVKLDFSQLADEFRALRAAGFDLRQEFQINPLNFAHYRLLRFGLKEFSPEFNAAYLNALSQVQQWADEHGLKLVWWLVDEPRENMVQPWNRNLADTVQYLKLARHIPNLRTTITPMADVVDGVDHTPMIPLMDIVQTHPWARSKRQIEMARANPKQKLWFYNGGVGRFVFGFYPWAAGAHGYWQWHYQWWSRPYDIFANENWGVVMPSPDGPLPTLGYELSREGINDYRYVTYLESLIARSGEHPVAVEAARFLEKIRKQIPQWPESGLVTGEEAGASAPTAVDDQLDGWRAQIIAFLLQLAPRKE